MRKRCYRVLVFFEALGLAAYIGWYIWQLQDAHPNSWIVFPVWLAISVAAHRDAPKTLGWRSDNLWPASQRAAKVFLVFIAAICVAAAWLGAFYRRPVRLMEARHFFSYLGFCLLQQVALNSYLTNRLLDVFESRSVVALVAGIIFAALHWPNPVLVPLTLVGGFAMSWLFAKERNILPITLGQAVLGALICWAFPNSWHHGMRVGPGFYTFHP